MIKRVGYRLPRFNEADLEILVGSSDFFGLNHYTTLLASEAKGNMKKDFVFGNGGLSKDQHVNLSVDKEWKKTKVNWSIVPWGLERLLHWIDDRYDQPEIVITKNGTAFDDKVVDGVINNQSQIDFYQQYLMACHDALASGVNLTEYFAWSLMDNFEWASGFSKRFGIYHVDFETQERTPKASAKWYQKIIQNGLPDLNT